MTKQKLQVITKSGIVWDKEHTRKQLANNPTAQIHAVILLQSLQTDREKVSGNTLERNLAGFDKHDASNNVMKKICKKVNNKNFNFTEVEKEYLSRRMPRYWRQCLEYAIRKQAQV